MHVINMRISETVFHIVPDTLRAPMEQAILKESLLLQVGEFIWEPILDLGTKVSPPRLQRKGLILPPPGPCGKSPTLVSQRTSHSHILW